MYKFIESLDVFSYSGQSLYLYDSSLSYVYKLVCKNYFTSVYVH